MGEAKFTPSPWDLVHNGLNEGSAFNVHAGKHHITKVVTRADAHLIAAAPIMYETLALARIELSRWGWGDFHYATGMQQDPQVLAAITMIDTALAKARGDE